MSDAPGTLNMVIAALGGEGGGVLTNWLIEAADHEGWHCQTTSLAGVAQRTGATIYYLEFMDRREGAPPPVMSLFPAQGDIDVAVASEIAEAGRMLSRGFISPDRTTLIASDHRVYGITETSAIGDGSIDAQALRELAARYTARYLHFDMRELVRRHGTVISAALFGAIAGSGVLPFARQTFLDIVSTGPGASANRAAFEESRAMAENDGVVTVAPKAEPAFALPEPTSATGRALLPELKAFPASCQEVVYRALERLVDYQDAAYARDYLYQLKRQLPLDDGHNDHELTTETARYLGLWLCFEDIPRVAQLKIRPGRIGEIREEVRAAPGQPIQVTEFFHPRVEEVCAILPNRLGGYFLKSPAWRRFISFFTGAKQLRTDTLPSYFTLRFLASLRRFRRASLGYAQERQMIDRWFTAVLTLAAEDPATAREMAECGRMVKGYGATRHRTTTQLMAIVGEVEAGRARTAQAISTLRQAALSGEDSARFNALLSGSAYGTS